MRKKGTSEPSFEELFVELEATVQQLEAGNLTLDASLGLYERGMQLAKMCSEQLDNAQLRITELAPPAAPIMEFDPEDENQVEEGSP